MSDSNAENGSRPEDICLSCGLCCNGVIFADVKLLPKDDAAGLVALGMPLIKSHCGVAEAPAPRVPNRGWRFLQPCAAHDGCRCRIYGSRPKYCRDFECLLLKTVQRGRVTPGEALKVIRATRRRAEKVRKLLRALGDDEETCSLAARFRRMTKALQRAEPDAARAELYGRLTLAFHKLRLALNDSFYPAPPRE